jgi:hypothetical protein
MKFKMNNTNQKKKRAGNSAENRTAHLLELVLDQLKLQSPSAPPLKRDVAVLALPRRQLHLFRRSYDGGLVATGATPTFGVITTSLSLLPNFTEFTALYDAYRIVQIRATFYPISNNVLPSSSRFYTVIDYDDGTAFTTVGDAEQYDSCQTSSVDNNTAIQRVYNPRIAQAVYSGAFTSFAQSLVGTWIDTASSTVQHYGLKWALDASTGVTNVFRIEVDCVIQCKNSR